MFYIRLDIKGASHFTVDGLNYFILFVCSAVLPGGRTRPPRRRVPHRTPPRALETSSPSATERDANVTTGVDVAPSAAAKGAGSEHVEVQVKRCQARAEGYQRRARR